MRTEHDRRGNKGAFQAFDGDRQAGEMTYVWAGDAKFIIDHTGVGDDWKGKGVGKQLVAAAVEFARSESVKILPLCPFAKRVFEKVSEFRDVLDN